MTQPQIGDEILDTRDIEKRIQELEDVEGELDDARDELTDAQQFGDPDADLSDLEEAYHDALAEFDGGDEEELADLRELRDDLEGYCDWTGGGALISEDYFETYAEELAYDIGAVDRNADWPVNRIDWTVAAEDLKQDYTYTTIKGETYYVRMC